MAEPPSTIATSAAPSDAADPEQLSAVETNSFDTIFSRYSRQRDVQTNDDVPDNEEDAIELHLSDAGFAALSLPEGSRFIRLSSRALRAQPRPDAVIENHQVDQVIVHAFGWDTDKPNLEHRRAGSPVEPGSGYDPAKVARTLQQMLSGARQAAHCVISRRGDIYCLVPWSHATRMSSPRESTSDIPDRSITVALEARYTARAVAYTSGRADLPIAMADPFTAAQLTALAFVARKVMTWAGLTSLSALTGASSELLPQLGSGGAHAPGMLAYAAYDYTLPAHSVPELLLPEGYILGPASALPAELRRDAVVRAWTDRIETLYPLLGYASGTALSAWLPVTETIAALPNYQYATELFAPASSARVFEAAPPSGALTASVEHARVVTGEGYQRAYDMSSAARSALYDAASVALDATVIATMEKEARERAAISGVTHVAITQSALGFDFADGQWKYMDVPVEPRPGVITVQGRSDAAPP